MFKRALVGSLSINNHPYILTLEPFNEKEPDENMCGRWFEVLERVNGYGRPPAEPSSRQLLPATRTYARENQLKLEIRLIWNP